MTQWLAKPELQKEVDAICPPGGHADERETAICLAVSPGLVKMESAAPGPRLGRLKHLNAFTAIWWYADFPGHVAGDGRSATAEKGKRLLEIHVRALAEVIRQVKDDRVAGSLEKEFFDRADKVAE